MRDTLLNSLTQGAQLLTANRRLARHWRRVYDAAQQQSGAMAWPAPSIHNWPDWVSESIEALLPDRIIPSPFAELRGWHKIIGDAPLLDRAATAAGAAQAWALCQQYLLPLDHPAFDSAEDTAQFRDWARQFELRAAKNHWLPAARREAWLAGQLSGTMREVWLDGFDETTPAQRLLLQHLNHRAYQEDAPAAARVSRARFPDARAEIHASACWARTQLESGEARSVGIVVQNLARLRPDVETIFHDILGAPLFNLSLGLPLTNWPIVADALLWLRWLATPLDIGEAGLLLRSPFFGEPRPLLDIKLRADNVLQVPFTLAGGAPHALERLNAQPRRQTPGGWARLLPALLLDAGWPGKRTQSSAERQALARWQQLLRDFAALDLVEGPLPFGPAIALLGELAAEAIFQPETAEMPVQILEALQAAGSRFDALWAMGMTDTAWPAPSKPNAFLPRSLQRQFDLPHATPERELRFARDLTARLLRSAPYVIFSHPEREEDEELRPSRLLAAFPEAPVEARSYPGYAIATPLDVLNDESAPALPPATRHRGGTALLSAQSVCPFRAFATYRLAAEEWNEPQPGLTPLERGTALHTALASLWDRFRTRKALASASFEERDAALDAAVAAGCAELEPAGRQRLVGLEAIRLRAVLADWIELDFERDEFTVEAIEHTLDLAAPGPAISARADRIDRLPGGELVLIDYKSTAPNRKAWSGDRPDNLQLPLYATGLPETPSAIVFAQLKRGEHKFEGLAAREGLVPGVKPPPQGWEQQLADWREVISRIWAELQAGRADVDPKDAGRTCETCHLHSLCRIREAGLEPLG